MQFKHTIALLLNSYLKQIKMLHNHNKSFLKRVKKNCCNFYDKFAIKKDTNSLLTLRVLRRRRNTLQVADSKVRLCVSAQTAFARA